MAGLLLHAAPAAAQARARVREDGTTIWRPGFLGIATVVGRDTELEVVGRFGDWIEVWVPARPGTVRARGFVAASAVLVVGDIPTPADVPGRPAASARAAARGRVPPFRPSGFSRNGARAFITAGYGLFAARETFDAMFGAPGGPSYGVGAEVQASGGAFLSGSVDYFRLDGQRVFVADGEVYRLGVTDVVTILPVEVSGGYRAAAGRAAPYVGAGIGRYFLRDVYETADAAARAFQSFTSVHVLVGVEWWAARHAGVAFEVQYSRVPHALNGGVGADLGEDDLGGLIARVKVVVGR